MANIDPFKTAPTDVEAQKKAVLQAVADGGMAGKQAYDRAQATVEAQRAAAIQGAMSRAASLNAPDAFIQSAQQEAAAPSDTALSNIAQGRATFEQDMARQQSSGTSYLDKVGAAIPIVNARSQADIANTLTQAEQETKARQDALMEALQNRMENARQRTYDEQSRRTEAQQSLDLFNRNKALQEEQHGWAKEDRGADQAWEREQHDMARELARLQLAQTQASAARSAASSSAARRPNYAGAGTGLGDLVHNLGGQTLAKAQLLPSVKNAFNSGMAEVKAKSNLKGLAGNRTTTGQRTHFSQVAHLKKSDIMDMIGSQLGLGQGELSAFLGKQAPDYRPPGNQINARKFSTKTQTNLRAKPAYSRESKEIIAGLQELRTPVGKPGSKDYQRALDLSTAKKQIAAQIRSDKGYAKQPMLYELLISDLLSS